MRQIGEHIVLILIWLIVMFLITQLTDWDVLIGMVTIIANIEQTQ